jgi:hypothetical protein
VPGGLALPPGRAPAAFRLGSFAADGVIRLGAAVEEPRIGAGLDRTAELIAIARLGKDAYDRAGDIQATGAFRAFAIARTDFDVQTERALWSLAAEPVVIDVVIIGQEVARRAQTAVAGDANARSGLLGAADLGRRIAAWTASVRLPVADFAEGIFAVGFGAALGSRIDAHGRILGGRAGTAHIAWFPAGSAGAAVAQYADPRTGLLGAADLGGLVAARHTGMCGQIAALAWVATVAIITTGARHANRSCRSITDDMCGRQSTRSIVGRAAELFAVTGAEAAGVVAAFGMAR